VSSFQRFSAFDENTIDRAHPSADHDSSGRGQTKGTWTGDAQDGDGILEWPLDDELMKTTTTLQQQQKC